MPDIINLKSLTKKLRTLEANSRRGDTGSVIVGYNANYAVFVHENLEAAHGAEFNRKNQSQFGKRNKKGQFLKATGTSKKRGENQQAKFLEKPLRDLGSSGELSRILIKASKSRIPLLKALILVGLRIQRESQKIVPVDTGNLKGSAFTEIE